MALFSCTKKKKPQTQKPGEEEKKKKKKRAFSRFLRILRSIESYYSNLYLISLDRVNITACSDCKKIGMIWCTTWLNYDFNQVLIEIFKTQAFPSYNNSLIQYFTMKSVLS